MTDPTKLASIDQLLAEECGAVPGFVEGALALLPEGLLIGSVGFSNGFAGEPLGRAAARCLAHRHSRNQLRWTEHAFISAERLIVIQRGHRHIRLALALVCSRDANLQFVIHSTRRALIAVEAELDWEAWEA